MEIQMDILAKEIEQNLENIIQQNSEKGTLIWNKLISAHPAEIALVFNDTADRCVLKILETMDEKVSLEIFSKLSVSVQANLISHFSNERLTYFFKKIPADEITTILEDVPDNDLEKYLKLTNKKRREKITASLKSDDKTAGRILNSDVLILHQELTIKKVVSMFQQMNNKFEILPRQYVVSADLKLIGFIEIFDLLKYPADTKISSIFREIDLKVFVDDNQEEVADLIRHYELFAVPVTDENNQFLGVITANDVIDVLEEEITEDSYKMAGISSIEQSYANASFWTIIIQRCKWLVPLLLIQSISGFVLSYFSDILTGFSLATFITMLVGTGGNVGNQSTTFFVRGLATGEINRKNKKSLLFREIFIAITIGFVLVFCAFLRSYLFYHHLPSVLAVSISLFAIILTSVFLGTVIPVILDNFGIDPASSAVPIISTLMDVIGVTIYCLIASFILK